MLLVFRILTALIAIAQIFLFRFQLFQEDAVNYLDLSDYAMQSNWTDLVNGHFCPLYPVLIAGARTVFHFSPEYEPLLLKLVNLVCFALSWLAFEYFLKAAFENTSQDEQQSERTLFAKSALYAAFVYASLCLGGLYQDTPDYLTNAALFYASAMVLRLRAGGSVRNFVLLGLVLGLGFLAKTVAFYFGLIFIAVMLILVRKDNSAMPGLAALITVFVVLCAPFIFVLSQKSGHLTLGDSGKLCWITYIGGLSDIHARTADFIHPSRIIHNLPKTFEFGGHDTSTYSAFLNQSYWYDGARMNFPVSNIFQKLFSNVLIYLKHGVAAILLSGGLYWCLAKRHFVSIAKLKQYWFLFAVPLAGMAMYAIVTPLEFAGDTRYYSGLLTLLVAACLLCHSDSLDQTSKMAEKLTTFFFCLALFVSCLSGINVDYEATLPEQRNIHLQLAHELNQLGIRPDDSVCQLGFRRGGSGKHYYFVRLAGAKITADIPDEDAFWKLPNEERDKVIAALKRTGVKAIVEYPWSCNPPIKPPPPWKWMHYGNCWALMI